ncbi:MAG: hypothetical protein ABI419_00495 [Ginsengibacter sp.]
MIHKFFLTILLSSVGSASIAQTMRVWNWNSYNMKFKAPDNMVVIKSDGTVYEASNNKITMDIYPRKDENLTYDGMKAALVKWADDLSLYYKVNSSGETQPIYLSNINGYWGCAIDGSKSGFSASVLLLVDPDHPNISFYIWISYAKEYYHDVVNILKSFTPM